MSRLNDEIELVPRPAFAIGMCVWLAFFLLMMLVPFRLDPVGRSWPLLGKLAVSILPGIPLFILVLLIGYVYADSKRRGMRYVMWTLLAALIPNAIGIILYFVLRDPLPASCTRCGTTVRPGFAFCPKCGAPVAMACPNCNAAVELGWTHCVKCGVSVKAA